MKRLLLVFGAAVLFVSTFVTPTIAARDGGATGTNCGGSMCKP